jgi:glycosyltransferase involved in cell wall biosynthesis
MPFAEPTLRRDPGLDLPPGRAPLRILMVAGSYPPHVRGGGEISTKLLAEGLAGLGCDVRVLACGPARQLAGENGVAVERVPSPNLYWNFETRQGPLRKFGWHLLENWNPRARRQVAAAIDGHRPDLALTSSLENFGAEAWVAAEAAGVPAVHVLRSFYVLCWRGSAFKRGRNCDGGCFDCRALSLGRRRATSKVSGVVGISRHVLDQHLERGLFPAARPTVIANPAGADAAPCAKGRGAPVRFGYLGVLSPNKGLELLARAWKQRRPGGSKLLIAGRGDPAYQGRLQEEFGGSAEWRGWVESRKFLEEVDFLVVPSVWNEPFGRIVVEAFAAGVPVIASDTGGLPELIDVGMNGFLFRRNDAAGLAETMERAAALPDARYRAMSQAALDGSAGYTADAIARRYLAFLNEVVAREALRPAGRPG